MVGQVENWMTSTKFLAAVKEIKASELINANALARKVTISNRTAKKYLEALNRMGFVEEERYQYRSNVISKNYRWVKVQDALNLVYMCEGCGGEVPIDVAYEIPLGFCIACTGIPF